MKKLLPDSITKAWRPPLSPQQVPPTDDRCCDSDSDSSSCGCNSTAKSVAVDTADLAVDIFSSGYASVSYDRAYFDAGCSPDCLCCRGVSAGLQCCQQDACVDTADLPVDPQNCWCRRWPAGVSTAAAPSSQAPTASVGTTTDVSANRGGGCGLALTLPVSGPRPKPDLKRVRLNRRRMSDNEASELTVTSPDPAAATQDSQPVPSFECAECGERFTCKDLLSVHLRLHSQSPDGPSVSMCDSDASDASSADASNGRSDAEETTGPATAGRKQPAACALCKKSFRFPAALYNHLLTAHRHQTAQTALLAACRPGHVCSACGKGFRCASALAAHNTVHSGSRAHPCPDCRRRFASRSGLNAHRSQQHPAATGTDRRPPAPFRCEDCGASFTRRESLRAHRRHHTGERPFACAQCGAAFGRRFSLSNHMAVHSSERPHVCCACGKAFATRTALGNHERGVHGPSDRGPHRAARPPRSCVCDACGKLYSSAGNLAAHRRLAHPAPTAAAAPSAFRCGACGAEFTRMSSLRVHCRGARHAGARPHVCSACGRGFLRASTLRLHAATHAAEPPLRCPRPGCSRAFAQPAGLRYHLRHHYPERTRKASTASPETGPA